METLTDKRITTLQFSIRLLTSNKSHTVSKVNGKATQEPTC